VDGAIKAFLSYDAADALAQADAADKELAAGGSFPRKPLLGVPIALKDVLCVKGHPCNWGRKFGNFIS
jgi:Asp-tRNA(Asn)/Glu-tRNA(Gln) amidotransferase A subunit family amidase